MSEIKQCQQITKTITMQCYPAELPAATLQVVKVHSSGLTFWTIKLVKLGKWKPEKGKKSC